MNNAEAAVIWWPKFEATSVRKPSLGKRILKFPPIAIACAVLLSIFVASIGPADCAGIVKSERANIHYSDISRRLAESVGSWVDDAARNISKYLRKRYTPRVTVRISDRIKRARATIPRAEIEIPANLVRGDYRGPRYLGGPPITHELGHLIAGRPALHSFLSEGLAVHLQARIGLHASYPNGDEDLHIVTARVIRDHGSIIPVRRLDETKGYLGANAHMVHRLAYLQMGSFTAYLIDTHGLEKYLAIYNRAVPFEEIYGKSLDRLFSEWETFIRRQGRYAQ